MKTAINIDVFHLRNNTEKYLDSLYFILAETGSLI